MVTQDYVTDVPKVFVINGNSALLKCVIPSMVADFISVESWTDDSNNEFFSNINYGNLIVSNLFIVFWLNIPSHKQQNSLEFSNVEVRYTSFKKNIFCQFVMLSIRSRNLQIKNYPIISVVTQDYETDADREYVIVGNSAIVKCEVPSFVADFVSVESWKDNENNEYFLGDSNNLGNFRIAV